MASRLVAVLTCACLLAAAPRPALAQGVPPPPAAAPSAPTSFPAPPQAATSRAVGPGLVRAHFHTSRDRGIAKIYHRQGDTYAGLCSTPCTADVAPDAQLRVVLDDHDDEPYDFAIGNQAPGAARTGGEVDVLVTRGGKGALAGGIVMTSLGGLTAVVGLLLLAASALSSARTAADVRTAGYVTLAVGGGVAIGGIVIIANRSEEARVKVRGRAGYASGDVDAPADARVRGPSTPSRAEMFATEAGSGAGRVRAPAGPTTTVLSVSF